MAGYERGAPSQVVQNSLQARLDQKEIPKLLGRNQGTGRVITMKSRGTVGYKRSFTEVAKL